MNTLRKKEQLTRNLNQDPEISNLEFRKTITI